jgi:hydrogenase/urease accessory protein HupE
MLACLKRTGKHCIPVIAAILTLLLPATGRSHEAGVTDTVIRINRDTIDLVYTVPQDHIPDITGTDINPLAMETAQKDVLQGFEVRNQSLRCTTKSQSIKELPSIMSMQFQYTFDCGGPVRSLEISYNLLFDSDTSHKNLTRINLLQHSLNTTFTTANRTHVVDVESLVRRLANNEQSAQSATSNLMSGSHYFRVGAEHILLGFDHLLFLAALLLLPLAFSQVLALITAFTVAHSITLGLSVMDIVTLKPPLVETAIAFSVIYIALETLVILRRQPLPLPDRRITGRRIAVTFVFGLIHGFGFSYLLKEMGLGDQAWSSLLFFNLGVEAGQIIAVAAFLPVIYYLFKRFPQAVWAQVLAVFLAAIGTVWFFDRLPSLI